MLQGGAGSGLEPRNSSRDGEGSVNLARLDWATRFHADAVALCHCFIPVLLRHLQPAIRRQFLEMTKSVAEASSATPGAARDQAGLRRLIRTSASTVIAFRLTPVLYVSGLSRRATAAL